jgi:hypothetical protein
MSIDEQTTLAELNRFVACLDSEQARDTIEARWYAFIARFTGTEDDEN